jgi:hypothetical protein
MSMMLIDSGVDTVADLVGLLPTAVADTVDYDTLLEADFASSLRMLATIKNEGWYQFVRTYRVDWDGLLSWARREFRTTDSVLVRAEIAASLAGHSDSQALLLYGARALDDPNYEALIDALRIARQGVSR